jgi:hypothetical protein
MRSYVKDTSGIADYRVSNGGMTDEWWIGQDLEGSDCGIIEVLSHHLLRGTKESLGETLVRMACVRILMRIEHLPLLLYHSARYLTASLHISGNLDHHVRSMATEISVLAETKGSKGLSVLPNEDGGIITKHYHWPFLSQFSELYQYIFINSFDATQ